MIKLKTYEEFNWSPESSTIAGYVFSLLAAKIGSKLLLKKKERDSVKKMMKNSIYTTSSKWLISETGDLINISNIDTKRVFTIDKKNRTIEYKSEIYPLKAKLNKNDITEIVDSVYFAKDVSESIDDCFYDLVDEGFTVTLISLNFTKKAFAIKITLKGDRESWGRDRTIPIHQIGVQLNETLQKIIGQYDVVVDDLPGVNDLTQRYGVRSVPDDGYIVTEYKDGVIKIIPFNSDRDVVPVSSLISTDIDLMDMPNIWSSFGKGIPQLKALTIPFIKK